MLVFQLQNVQNLQWKKQLNVCYIPSHTYLKIHSFSTAIKKGVGDLVSTKTMDPISVEAMLTESGVKLGKARIMFLHIKQFFGRSLFSSEKKRQRVFSNNAFPLKVGRKTLPDKTIVDFWYKPPQSFITASSK